MGGRSGNAEGNRRGLSSDYERTRFGEENT